METNEMELKIKFLEMENKRLREEVDARKKLNEAQIQYREDSLQALLKDIGRSLKAEYEDFFLSENDEMDLILGEIYRGKLKNIAKILKRKGIIVSK